MFSHLQTICNYYKGLCNLFYFWEADNQVTFAVMCSTLEL